MMKDEWPPKNRVMHSWTHSGLDCLVLSGPLSLCGYVRVPTSHPAYGKEYDTIEVLVHGGLTFSCDREDGTWFGFDCAHGRDTIGIPLCIDTLTPKWACLVHDHVISSETTTWTIDDVARETCLLAQQLSRMKW